MLPQSHPVPTSRRAPRLAALVAVLAVVAAGATLLAPRPIGLARAQREVASQQVTLTFTSAHYSNSFALGAVGLSIEAFELDTPDLSADHESLVSLMQMLGPGVLRLGGNSLDFSWWDEHGEQSPGWATSVASPPDLVMLRSLLEATGWRAILGVDLGHFDPERAAAETASARRILGSRLLGIEIGNEPNLYGSPFVDLRPSSYSVGNYVQELGAYDQDIRAAAPTTRLYGPDLSSQISLPSWLPSIAPTKSPPFTAITLHYYPTYYSVEKGVCKGTAMPTALELLSPQVRERENAVLESAIKAGQFAHREVRISETNTTASCDTTGGPATSPVFASALWALDWSLRATSAGVAGLNFHGYFGRCTPGDFSPICAPGYAAESSGRVIARPEYYGLLAARQLEGGRFLSVHASRQAANSDFTTYATKHHNGEITLAIDNFSTASPASLLVRIPGYKAATEESLVAPSLSSTGDVTFGHASFSAPGTLQPRPTTLRKVSGAFGLRVQPASAMIVTFKQ